MSAWCEAQVVRAVLMAMNGATDRTIAVATSKETWEVRKKLASHGILIDSGAHAPRIVAVKISAAAHVEFNREASRRGFSVDGLLAHIAEIAAGDRLFDAVLGDHRGVRP